MRRDFLYLSEQDTIDAGVLDTAACIDVCETVFALLHAGDYLMGGASGNSHGLGLPLPVSSPFPNMPVAGPDRRFVTMPAYVGGGYDVCGNKWYGSNPDNAANGLPRSVLTMMLNDKSTGEPLCLMSANQLSAARTGAIPAVAARHLARKDSAVLAVLGTGAINRACVTALVTELPGLSRVVCYDLFPAAADAFALWCQQVHGVEAVVGTSPEDVLRDADVATVAASRLSPLHVDNAWVKAGATVLLTGPVQGDDSFWLDNTIVYDHIGLHEAYVAEAIASPDRDKYYSGLIGGPLYRLIDSGRLPALSQSRDLGAAITADAPARTGDDERVIFVACGMAVFDVAWGTEVYRRALDLGIGIHLDLWGQAAHAGAGHR